MKNAAFWIERLQLIQHPMLSIFPQHTAMIHQFGIQKNED